MILDVVYRIWISDQNIQINMLINYNRLGELTFFDNIKKYSPNVYINVEWTYCRFLEIDTYIYMDKYNA